MTFKKFTSKNNAKVIKYENKFELSWDMRDDDNFHRLLNEGLNKGYIRKANGTECGGYEMLLLDYPATNSDSEKYYYSRPKAFEVARKEDWMPFDGKYDSKDGQIQLAVVENYMMTQALMNHMSPLSIISVSVKNIDTGVRITDFSVIKKGKIEKAVKKANDMASSRLDHFDETISQEVLDSAEKMADIFTKKD